MMTILQYKHTSSIMPAVQNSLQTKFILVVSQLKKLSLQAICTMSACITSILLLTFYNMGSIVQNKLQSLVAGFFFGEMIDQTQAIANNFQDGLHLVQMEFVSGKKLIEYTQANLNQDFKDNYDYEEGVEWSQYYQPSLASRESPNYSKFAWYAFPKANGSSAYYTLNKNQERDVEYCRNSFFFHKAVLMNQQLLISYDTYFFGFASGVQCFFPSHNASLSRTAVKTSSITFCYCDEMKNCYFSPLCRAWYKSLSSHPNQCLYEDLYLFANGNVFGLGVCAPLNGTDGKFVGGICANVVPSFIEGRPGSEKGNYIRNMYLAQTQKANYVVADNQNFVSQAHRLKYIRIQWDPNWKTENFKNYVMQVIDFANQSKIQDFKIRYQFPQSHNKIAYFAWNNTNQQGIPSLLTPFQCNDDAKLFDTHPIIPRAAAPQEEALQILHPGLYVRVIYHRGQDRKDAGQVL
ncbi:hypothetical protein FGO68_gene5430 [Halteria grandinella]|uniref:Uncharacterized protein n=1 Tax=Halteria grandinella TaxID=5974 RepID=A0A8J8P248_HALGN|nr:hypothetical protein FGO68_gene5430 [Halteria grandinella]